MAYIPPHKRHSKETERPLPIPELLAPQFKKNLIINPSKSNRRYFKPSSSVDTSYAKHCIWKWCTIGLDDQNQFPSYVKLHPIALESTEWNIGEKPLVLINTCLDNEGSEGRWKLPKSPWVSIAEIVVEDLFSSFKNMRNEMEPQKLKQVKPNLVARVGKILFNRIPAVNLDSTRESLDTEILNQSKRSFYTYVPVSYMENIVKEVVQKIGVDFKEEKEMYRVKLSDSRRPKSTITCKCSVIKEHGKLQLNKVVLNHLRNMVIDLSCPNKNLDLRLMLCTKRSIIDLTDDEMQSITDLLSSALLDPNVKGGLRWPLALGKASSGDQFKVVGIWHTTTSTYENPSLKLKVRHANRFDFRTSAGEAFWEVRIFLKTIVSKLQEQNVEVSSIFEMLQENARLIWENFLCCEHFLT